MRDFADTLPTLRETGPAAEPDSSGPFSPLALTRALGSNRPAGSGPRKPRRARDERDEARAGVDEQSAGAAQGEASDAAKPGKPLQREGQGRQSALKAAGKIRDGKAPLSAIPPLASQTAPADDAVATAVEAALAKARAQAEQALQEALAAERERASAELAEARARWCEQEAAALATSLNGTYEALKSDLSDAFARCLMPIVEEAVAERCVAQFAELLTRLAGPASDRPTVTVRAPKDFTNALEAALGQTPGIVLEASETAEILAEIGQTRLETTLKTWADALSQALRTQDGK